MKIFIVHYNIVFWGNWTQFHFNLGNIFVENLAKNTGADKEYYMWKSCLTLRRFYGTKTIYFSVLLRPKTELRKGLLNSAIITKSQINNLINISVVYSRVIDHDSCYQCFCDVLADIYGQGTAASCAWTPCSRSTASRTSCPSSWTSPTRAAPAPTVPSSASRLVSIHTSDRVLLR